MSRSIATLMFVGVTALVAGCMTKPVEVAPAQPIDYANVAPAPAQHTGSLFQAASYRPAFEDPRARFPGDTLTIQITEKVSASQKSTSSIDRTGSASGGVSAIPGIRAADLVKTKNFDLGGESANNFAGKGDTVNDSAFSGSITATVQQVLPNGHLVVVGEKQVGVNDNVDVLRFSGRVDPRTIRPGNVVASAQVADVRVDSRSRGAIGEAQTIGWLSRIFLNVFPF
ncbi:flagellar basal body L-ring protein FlgH [Hydrogenophaga sp. 5NK40-0174]|uniref:flagellar basal body L-ring protein FlgH n=1 Tax=Hydrogenophaga sp. 5NK40-0174 TaxID=3127649 RepID=UPI00310AF959